MEEDSIAHTRVNIICTSIGARSAVSRTAPDQNLHWRGNRASLKFLPD